MLGLADTDKGLPADARRDRSKVPGSGHSTNDAIGRMILRILRLGSLWFAAGLSIRFNLLYLHLEAVCGEAILRTPV